MNPFVLGLSTSLKTGLSKHERTHGLRISGRTEWKLYSCRINRLKTRHSRAGGNPAMIHSAKRTKQPCCPASRGLFQPNWIPACAGMTRLMVYLGLPVRHAALLHPELIHAGKRIGVLQCGLDGAGDRRYFRVIACHRGMGRYGGFFHDDGRGFSSLLGKL